jgi:hypothetical protein
MEEIILKIQALIKESPVEDATKHHDKSHIKKLVDEDLSDVSDSGFLNTDKYYLTRTIRRAAVESIKENLGQWVSKRNQVIIESKKILSTSTNSELDSNKAQIEKEQRATKAKIENEFIRDNQYSDIKAQHELSKKRYTDMRAEMGGKPPVQSKFLLYVIAILLIGFIEWFINYSTFSSMYPPGIAFGATIIIALSIALASHFHGALLKQRLSLFAKHRAPDFKLQVILVQAFFSLLVVAALIVVTITRYEILTESMAASGGISLPGQEQNESIFTAIFIFVLMNMIVWIIGVAISYFIHDSTPDYQEAFKDHQKSQSKFYSVDKAFQKEMERIDAELKEDMLKLTNSYSSQLKDEDALKNKIEQLRDKESSIIKQATSSINDMLSVHQSILITELDKKGITELKIGPDEISLQQYKKQGVEVGSDFVRSAFNGEFLI